MQYQTLLNILDAIIMEAPVEFKRYQPDPSNIEKTNQARSRALIHLYLKVMFGLTDFKERERTITDQSQDGGIDGYHIESEQKVIYLIQSKFRANQENFEEKEITLDELLSMDVNRILDGEKEDESGVPYNGKILQLQREISSLPDAARYSYRIIILANLKDKSQAKLRQLTGGFSVDVFNFEKTYQKLVFPVLTGTYFKASEIIIPFDLSSKNAGSKISYNVITKYGSCEITVLFVPSIEIARVMDKYRNAILEHNPRSYLDLEGQSVNASIRDTILNTQTNEFALFNNGITMLSEETNINEQIGKKNQAQLRVKNPQIINGGQTSFTLSRIYSDNKDSAEEIFQEKEVLLKIITLLKNDSEDKKIQLIDEISNATNKQTPVINADRFANEAIHIELQHRLFERYGFLYERKRGEFSDGIRDGYIDSHLVLERNHFWRLMYSTHGMINRGFQKKLFQKNNFSDILPISNESLDRFYLGSKVFNLLKGKLRPNASLDKGIYAKAFLYVQMFFEQGINQNNSKIMENILTLESKWEQFIEHQNETLREKLGANRGKVKISIIEKSPEFFNAKYWRHSYYFGNSLEMDLKKYLGQIGGVK